LTARYSVQAVDINAFYSEYSDYVLTMGQSMSKEYKQSFSLPKEYSLLGNYPNPFNPGTTINYQIPEAANVVLKVFDILGREVATLVNERKHAGVYNVQCIMNNVSSGVYFYTLKAGSFSETKKMLLLK